MRVYRCVYIYTCVYMATYQNHVPPARVRVHVPMLSDPEGLDLTLGPESLER